MQTLRVLPAFNAAIADMMYPNQERIEKNRKKAEEEEEEEESFAMRLCKKTVGKSK